MSSPATIATPLKTVATAAPTTQQTQPPIQTTVIPLTNKSADTAIQKDVSQPVPVVTPVAASKYIKYDTPLPDPDDAEYPQVKAVAFPERTLAPVDYLEIFHANQTFTGNSNAISFNLKNPPMIITYTAMPQELTDIKYTMNRDAGKKTSDGKIINVTRWDENSWFVITLFDKAKNGTVVEQDGFGRGFDQDLTEEITIRNPGNYQIKFEGNFISVDTSIKVSRAGNS